MGTYAQVLHSTGLFSTRVIETSCQRDSMSRPDNIKNSHFVGRQREVHEILGRLANPARGSSSISGDSQVGRTSLLHYLCEPHIQEAWGLSSDWCHFLYLDCL